MSASVRRAVALNDNGGAATASITFTSTAADQVGDIVLVLDTNTTGAGVATTPAGWTLLAGPTSTASNMKSYLFGIKLASGDLLDVTTFQWDTGGRHTGAALVIQGADTLAELVIGTPTTAAAATINSPSVTTVESDCLIAQFVAARLNATSQASISPPGTATEDAEGNSNLGVAPNIAVSANHKTTNSTTAGSYGGATFTSTSATHMHAFTVAVTSLPTNVGPVPDAGADQTGKATGATVTLSGSDSDPDGTVVTRAWSQVSGTAVTLSGAATATATFTVPSVASDETLVFRYTVTDDDGASEFDDCSVGILLDPPDTDDGGLRWYLVSAGGVKQEMAAYLVSAGGVKQELADLTP